MFAAVVVAVLGLAAAASFLFLASDHAALSGSTENPPDPGLHRFEVSAYDGRLWIEYEGGSGFRLGDLRVTVDGRVVEVCRSGDCNASEKIRAGDRLIGGCSSGVLRLAIERDRVHEEPVRCRA